MPDAKVTGPDYTLPPGLGAAGAAQGRLYRGAGALQQIRQRGALGQHVLAHRARTATRSRARVFTTASRRIRSPPRRLGIETRFASIQFSSPDGVANGHGPGLSLAWDARGKPLAGIENPLVAYHRLFSDETMPLAQRQAMLAAKTQRARRRADRCAARAARPEQDRHRQARRILSKACATSRPGSPRTSNGCPSRRRRRRLTEPKPGLAGRDEIELMYDLIVAALQTDATRVITYRQPVGTLLGSLGLKIAAHDMTHYTTGERLDASQRRDVAQSELLAGLLDKLKAVKEPDGTRLLDHTVLAYGSNIRTVHYLDNCPMILAGGGAGLKLGQHLVLPRQHAAVQRLADACSTDSGSRPSATATARAW